MHVLHLNYVFDTDTRDARELVARYATLREWAQAGRRSGVEQVSVVQRFHTDDTAAIDGVTYLLRSDGWPGRLRPWQWPTRLHRLVCRLAPDLVHVHGLDTPGALWHLRCRLARSAAIIVQDHASVVGGQPPRGLREAVSRVVRRLACRAPDAFFFSSAEQAHPWREAGLFGASQPVYGILEASTVLHEEHPPRREEPPTPRPLSVLWVGRLNRNKDPLTVLDGFAELLTHLPHATLSMVFGTDDLLPAVEARLAAQPELRARVELVGRLAPAALAARYADADVFVLGSHREGSGYALLEAMAFGVVPVVTAIPSFRAITAEGRVGALWTPGDAASCARALLAVARGDLAAERARCRSHFDAALSWSAVGRAALTAYETVLARRRASR